MAITNGEKYALTVMMCSPTYLSRAWTKSADDEIEKKVTEQLAALPFSPEAREEALRLMLRLKSHRKFFEGIADLFKAAAYSGNEPHPDPDQADAMVRKLLELVD